MGETEIHITFHTLSTSRYFTVDINGTIRNRRPFDYDNALIPNSFTFEIFVAPLGDTSTDLDSLDSRNVRVFVLDSNDNAPIFTNDNVTINAAENIVVPASLTTVFAPGEFVQF